MGTRVCVLSSPSSVFLPTTMSQQVLFGNPTDILKQGAVEEKGEFAKLSNIVGATAVADMVKSTLGPKGMDKILQSHDRRDGAVVVTNDGATIMKSVWMDNPAGKVLIEIAKTQDAEIGDGTTSVVVFAGELLREAERLLTQNIHPQTIIEGYRLASGVAEKALNGSSADHTDDKEGIREVLLNVARTSLSSKVLCYDRDHFAKLAVDAVLRLKGSSSLESINIIKKLGGTLQDSFLSEGFLLDKKIGIGQPRRLENPKILVCNTPMDTDKIKIYGARVRVSGISNLAEIERAEKMKMKQKCDNILAHGLNCFINRQLIYNYPEELFAQAGVMAIEHADFEGVERLALALGGEVASTFDHPEQAKFGTCKLIDEIMIGEDTVIRFSGLPKGEACTVVLRGSSQHLLDEAERSLHDALCVVSQTVINAKVVPGAGCSELLMADAVETEAKKIPGKKQLAMQSFANALRQLPSIVAENAGLDSADLITQLTAAHHNGKTRAGLDLNARSISDDVGKLGIWEPLKLKRSVLLYAMEAAECILRVDNIIRMPPRQRTR
eukprot:NODE_808_length_1765_cov_193.391026_g662_i0.p1 GENE.NODE_808_length_1765_cov_193.391026_g662_i0~~NODE_808_length_1765_cov_193.391026_g662_i0.p1  ORF type:complete len:563 (+),score=212.74 NODE_808_length_1765_cov_193.391026_g662_i0:28-1689(+)